LKEEKISVLFQPSGRRGLVQAGKTVLEAARELGIPVESVCGGKHSCGKCRVRVMEGDLGVRPPESSAAGVTPFSTAEEKFITPAEQREGTRLACVAQILGDSTIYIPEESRGKQQIIRKEGREINTVLNPAVKSYYLELPPPNFENPLADLERLYEALSATHGLSGLEIDAPTLQTLPQRLRAGSWKVTVFVWMDRQILDLQPGRVDDFFGLALDVGTTTVAAYLCNLKSGQMTAMDSIMNPQVAFGEDVMARITHAMMNPDRGLKDLHGAIIEGVNGLIRSVTQAAGITPEGILEITVVGNTAMHHLFLGIDPQFLGLSPFPPAVRRSLDQKARDLGIRVHPAANVHFLPIEAGFVGADNVGVLIAQTPYQEEEISLVIDIGTNGELVLGNKNRLVSASCATGPALEGAHLKFGMRAAIGAIERVRIDPENFQVKYKVIGLERWSDEVPPREIQARGICGSGIIEAVAELFRAGIIEKSGRFQGDFSGPRLRPAEKGFEFVLAPAEQTAIGQDITISLSDIRAVQLAKAALYAGAKILMKTLGVNRIDKVILAGGFGSIIDGERALILGMFPDCPLDRVIPVGNAAGVGACLALLNRDKRNEADSVGRFVEYVELTTDPQFTQEFIAAIPLPHQKDSFSHSSAART
jgi:uncharacterized 2Fe-2S/4Fe-4S cluster protein (DUF4445 family)